MDAATFEYDEDKSRLNMDKHGVSLAWARGLWRLPHVVVPARPVAGEERFVLLARVEEKCYAAVFAMRGGTIRLISCHRADRRWERDYEKKIKEKEA